MTAFVALANLYQGIETRASLWGKAFLSNMYVCMCGCMCVYTCVYVCSKRPPKGRPKYGLLMQVVSKKRVKVAEFARCWTSNQ